MRSARGAVTCLLILMSAISCKPSSTASDESLVSDGILASLTIPTTVRAGGEVAVRITLTNTSLRTSELQLGGVPSQPYFGIKISSANGDSLATILNAAYGNRALTVMQLSPGETVTMAATLQLPSLTIGSLLPGDYFVRGIVLGAPERRTKQYSLSVTN
jgi:hypothetical protein